MPRTITPPIHTPEHVRERLRALFTADGRSDTAIGVAAGMSQSYVSQVMNGHRWAPSIVTVGRILAALGRSWVDLDPAPAAATTTPAGRRKRGTEAE